MKNKLIIAAAGSGKTTFLVNEALKQNGKTVLITTYTQANELEIRKKIIEINRCIPTNITVQTWFSFLLQHGARPYQGRVFEKHISGMLLVNSKSGVKYVNRNNIQICYKEDTEFEQHYFTKNLKIYSDKLAKFVIRCNEKSNGNVIDRLSRIYSHIFIDEVQDLAGNDLKLLQLLFKSQSDTLLVGDPRQVTYLTHNESVFRKYTKGKIKEFIQNECKKCHCEIDEDSLNVSYRNNDSICEFSSKLFPTFKVCKSNQKQFTEHDGIFLVRKQDIGIYLQKYQPTQLRLNKESKGVNLKYNVLNFGESKGLSFDRVLIYPTVDMLKWLKDNNHALADKTRAQFYVALTRAKYSVGIVFDYTDNTNIDGVIKYSLEDKKIINIEPLRFATA